MRGARNRQVYRTWLRDIAYAWLEHRVVNIEFFTTAAFKGQKWPRWPPGFDGLASGEATMVAKWQQTCPEDVFQNEGSGPKPCPVLSCKAEESIEHRDKFADPLLL